MPETLKSEDPIKSGDKEKKSSPSPAKSNPPKSTPKDHEFETIVTKFFEKNKKLKEMHKPMGQMTIEEKAKYSSLIDEIENYKYLIRKTSITEIQDLDPKLMAVWNHLQYENLQTSMASLIESLKAETLQMRREQKQDFLEFKEAMMQKECLIKNQNPPKNIIETNNPYDNWTPKIEQGTTQNTNIENIVKRNLSPSSVKTSLNKHPSRNQSSIKGNVPKTRHDTCFKENKKSIIKDKNIQIEKRNQQISNYPPIPTQTPTGSIMNSMVTDLEKHAPLSAHEIINQNNENIFTTPNRAASESGITELKNEKETTFADLKRERESIQESVLNKEDSETESSDDEFDENDDEQFGNNPNNQENADNNRDDENFQPESNINREHISPVKSEMSLVTDSLINALNRMSKQSPCFQSMDPGKIKPWKFDDERATPAFIDEFESVTDSITDTVQKASYFRKLFKIELFPRCQTMPRNSNYEELKNWFLKVAWSKSERKRRILEIRKMTMESTKFSIVSQYIAYINAKLEQCQETPANRIHIIKKKLPLHIAIMSEPSWYSSPDKLINSLVALEKRNSIMEVGEQTKRQSKSREI
ncbi:hypothetical protein V9T40_004501 [Parthenolecanium corni]|uniref:Uncharacterized protein n=1 Tax=Parthenolecanium corni TaxID=536013 RepID=A0AAN9TU52_9HEMI